MKYFTMFLTALCVVAGVGAVLLSHFQDEMRIAAPLWFMAGALWFRSTK